MRVGTCIVELHLPECRSLKNKRQVIKALKERLRKKFNISVAEVDHNDLWQSAVLGIAVVAENGRFANEVLSKSIDLVNEERRVELVDYHIDIL
ncbi:hypothetical protein AMJ39_00250 [candidate division TA06 bacterium DG_24]|jgi:uncharacterized protein YlxP (DUF503 family)|uniref:DUF503 domain-containing protein n=3 Tax=Bacteria division TA06 TaxID=1156500 RepID=A0A0S8JP98_UNCT6|nr:MAG: hypothetical protein AMJ39_00250 [candidate division TA06 bacterium DG_24]KPK69052.1 MAG: hypothetical protein AMJ82_06655 [candidate division TA06 bacterium SM23_40]KPL10507.1 MAG: hypothetical protein AMJ71_02825 [candidate division TA06 bacterium SM1_40]